MSNTPNPRKHKRPAPAPSNPHPRVSIEGEKLGGIMNEWFKAGEKLLALVGEPAREPCSTCAFVRGTVPNGCSQTQLDAMKAVCEIKPFLCHHLQPGQKRPSEPCAGWFAAVQYRRYLEAKGQKIPVCPWPFSPPDEEPAAAELAAQ